MKIHVSLSLWLAGAVELTPTMQKQSPVRSPGLREWVLLLCIPSRHSHFGKCHPSPQCWSSPPPQQLGTGPQGLPLCPLLSQLPALPHRRCRHSHHPPFRFWLDIKTVPVAVMASSGPCGITGSSGHLCCGKADTWGQKVFPLSIFPTRTRMLNAKPML